MAQITVTMTFDESALTDNNISIDKAIDLCYLNGLLIGIADTIGDLQMRIMDEMVKEHEGNLFAAECIKYYRRDVKVLQDIKKTLKVSYSK